MVKARKPVPHQFVLDALEGFDHYTRPMFGCTAVYSSDMILLVLRDREDYPEDNGVWIATSEEHHASLRRELPSMRRIQLLGNKQTKWQNLPQEGAGFEEEALRACELVRRGDPRIGKIPKARSKKPAAQAKKRPSR